MMRVTDWQRWQRAKYITVGVLWLLALICIGGTEGTEMPPYSGLGVLLLVFAFALIANIEYRERELRNNNKKGNQ